jgi:hypothetical protein
MILGLANLWALLGLLTYLLLRGSKDGKPENAVRPSWLGAL